MAPILVRPRPAAALLALLLGGWAAGCVVTTHEGPGEPPAAPTRPGQAAALESSDTSTEAGSPIGKPTDDRPQTIAASHLLVMHAGSMRAPASITRSREEARARAEAAQARARDGEDFAALVEEYSDEPGAALRQGRLGRFNRDAMIEQFADAAFKLEPGEISEVVETPFGFHVILRTE